MRIAIRRTGSRSNFDDPSLGLPPAREASADRHSLGGRGQPDRDSSARADHGTISHPSSPNHPSAVGVGGGGDQGPKAHITVVSTISDQNAARARSLWGGATRR